MDTEFRKPKFKWHVFYTRLIPLVRNVDILWNSLHSEFKREKTGQQQQMPWHSVVAHEFFELPPNCCRHRSVVCIVCIWEFLESGFWILCVVYFVCCRGRRPSPVARRRRHRTRKNIQSQFLYVVPRTMCISMHKTRTHIPNAFICSVFSCCTLLFLCLSSHFVFVMLI